MDESERTDALASRKITRRKIFKEDSFQEHGKLPPQAVDIEEAVLGQLLGFKNALQQVVNLLVPEVFYREAHQVIYEAIELQYADRLPIDILTITDRLRKMGKLELVGGPFYITQLTSRVASADNIESHIGVLVEKYLKRETIRIATDITRKAFEDSEDAFDLVDELDRNTSKLNEYTVKSGSTATLSTLVDQAIKDAQVREQLAKHNKATGIDTGLKALNKLTGGWQNGDLIIEAARPGMGKTAVMIHHAKAAATEKPVAIFSLEVTKKALTNRFILNQAYVDPNKFKRGFISQDDWKDIADSCAKIKSLPIYIDDTPGIGVQYIRSKARVLKAKYGIGMIFIDYIQLINPKTSNKQYNRDNEVSEITRSLKGLAKELDVPVMALSQLNRNVEHRTGGGAGNDKIPQLSDLRDSGAIEQDADLIFFIYRPEYYKILKDDAENSLVGIGRLIGAKHREGSIDDVIFRYEPGVTHITDYESGIKESNPTHYTELKFKSNHNFDNVQ